MIENAFAGIVIVAQSFNPTIFTETWLDKNDVISADSLDGERSFTQGAAQFQSKDISVLVVPAKMEISFRIHEVSGDLEIPRKIPRRTIELLPHTPFSAIGLNFDFFVLQPQNQDFLTYNRALLGTGEYPLLKEFSETDAKFGRYFSKDYDEARLRLDIKPVKKIGPENIDLIKFNFNFHYDLNRFDLLERSAKAIYFLDKWVSLRAYSEKLVNIGSAL